MTFSSLSGKNNSPDSLLSQRLENIGVQEITLWKEMVLKDASLFNNIYSLIYCNNPRLAWHAAWVIDHVSEASVMDENSEKEDRDNSPHKYGEQHPWDKTLPVMEIFGAKQGPNGN